MSVIGPRPQLVRDGLIVPIGDYKKLADENVV